MDQAQILAVFLRGGSSRDVLFHAKDLPADRATQDAIVLPVLGSPAPMAGRSTAWAAARPRCRTP